MPTSVTVTEFLTARALETAVLAGHDPDRVEDDLAEARASYELVMSWRRAHQDVPTDGRVLSGYLAGLATAMAIQARRHRDHPDWDPAW